MLELSDPLWKKLDAAFRDEKVPTVLSELAETWSEEKAKSLFWDTLCHQGTCYGATYAAVPHLLKIAEPDACRDQRCEIAFFLGYVTLCALERRVGPHARPETEVLQGLPETLDGWDRKLDCYRSLVASFEDPNRRSSDYERTELLLRYKRVLAIKPVSPGDVDRIRSIGAELLEALATIGALCERALVEHLDDKDAVRNLLSGSAAASGLLSVARLLNFGTEGQCRCSFCDLRYEYILFGDRVAMYAEKRTPTMTTLPRTSEDRALRDYKEHAPSRSDGFIVPVKRHDVSDVRAASLISLADRATSLEPGLLLRNFLGSFICCKCDSRGPIQAI